MIKMKSGTCGVPVMHGDAVVRVERKTPNDEPFTLSPEAEERLVKRGVAVYANAIVPIVAPENHTDGGNADGQKNGYKDDEVLEIVDGHFTVESLMKLERKDMEALAADLEIEADAIKKCKNKTELANLIAEVEVGDEDENPTEDDEDGEGAPTFDPSEAVQ